MSFFKFWKLFMFSHLRLWEGDGDGGGDGGDGGDGNGDKAFTQKDIDASIEKAVGGLKTKNTELLTNVSKLTEQLKLYGDIKPEKIKEMMDKFKAEGEAQLIKDGRIDELVEKRVSDIKSNFEEQMAEITAKLATSDEFGASISKKHNDHVVKEGVMRRAIAAGVRKEAVDDIVMAAMQIFSAGEDGDPETRDEDGNLRKLGDKLFTADNWIESLRETRPHYWPDSTGAGAQGAKGDKGGKVSDLTARIQAAAASGDQVTYRKLRKEQLSGKK